MTVTVQQPRRGLQIRAAGTSAAVVGSRLLIVAVGAVSAVAGSRVAGWAPYDPGETTLHLGSVGNVLAASVDRWDAIHFLLIAQQGYQVPSDTTFFPLLPSLIRLVGPAVGSNVLAGVLINVAAFTAAMVLLHRLTVEELGLPAARATTLLLAFAPLSFYFTALYSESLFLALSLGAFYAARNERWRWAAILAAADSMTRAPGIAVLVPVAYMWWRSAERPRAALAWIAAALLPLACFGLLLQARGLGLLAPLHNESAIYQRSAGWVVVTIARAVTAGVHGLLRIASGGQLLTPDLLGPTSVPLMNVVELAVLAISLATFVAVWRRLPRAYGIYAATLLIVCLWSTLGVVPLRSFDRFALTIFPLWMVAGDWLQRHRALAPVLAVEALALIYYTHVFAIWGFVA